jgi:hypothetical protein
LIPFYSESLVSHLLCKNVKIKIYKLTILPAVLHGCETWSTLRKAYRLRIYENRMLGEYLDLRGRELAGGWKNCRRAAS